MNKPIKEPVDSSDDQVLDVAFNEYINNNWVAKYLGADGVITSLSDDTKDAQAKSVSVKDGDVYVAGFEYNSKNLPYVSDTKIQF